MRKGFTLVELLIVVIIIGILVTLAIPQYQKMTDRAIRSDAWNGLSALATGAVMRYTQEGSVASDLALSDLDIQMPDTTRWSYAMDTVVQTPPTVVFSATNSKDSGWILNETVALDTAMRTYQEIRGTATDTTIKP